MTTAMVRSFKGGLLHGACTSSMSAIVSSTVGGTPLMLASLKPQP
jgi:hypothetical protein